MGEGWFGDRFKGLQSVCSVPGSLGICVPSVQDRSDCPSSARNRAGQTWFSASSDSVDSCHVNFSGCWPVPHSIIEPLHKAIILWLLRASHTSKGNQTMCHDIFLIVLVAAPPDRQMWTSSLHNQIVLYCSIN